MCVCVCVHNFCFTDLQYCGLRKQALGPYGYGWNDDKEMKLADSVNITLIVHSYIDATIDPEDKVVNIDDDHLNQSKSMK